MKQYKVTNDKGYSTLEFDKGKGRGKISLEPKESIVVGILPREKDLFTIEEVKESIVTGNKKNKGDR